MIWKNVFYNNIATYISLINDELKEDFPLEPLSNHIKVLGGYAFKSIEYKDAGIPVIRISDFQDERIDLSGVRYYRENTVFDRYQLFADDIIIAMTGGTIGKLAIVQEGLGKLYLNQRVGKFEILNKEKFEPEYVYWLARGIQDKVKNLGYGGAQPNISNGQIEALQFIFPNKNVQLRIIEFLNDLRTNELKQKTYFNETVEEKILKIQNLGVNVFTILEECNQQQTYLQFLRQTILQEAVQGKLTNQDSKDEPATELLKRIKVEKEKLIKEGKLKKEKELPPITENEIPFELPEGWGWCRLGEIISLMDAGWSPACIEIPAPENKWGVLKTTAVQQMEYLENENKELPEKLNPKEHYETKVGDILITRAGPFNRVGVCCLVEKTRNKLMISDKIIRFHLFDEKVSSKFITLCLNTGESRGYIESKKSGMALSQVNISQDNLKATPIPLPPLAEQQRIVAKVQQLQQQLSQLETQVLQSREYAQQLLQSVLREAFEEKGKVYKMEKEITMVAEGNG